MPPIAAAVAGIVRLTWLSAQGESSAVVTANKMIGYLEDVDTIYSVTRATRRLALSFFLRG